MLKCSSVPGSEKVLTTSSGVGESKAHLPPPGKSLAKNSNKHEEIFPHRTVNRFYFHFQFCSCSRCLSRRGIASANRHCGCPNAETAGIDPATGSTDDASNRSPADGTGSNFRNTTRPHKFNDILSTRSNSL